ncbi:MAG: hypothetical protein OXB92_17280 [Acidimicrobiaceae bacterium]|nr:hypothetical protein [Acidimicrobiaceae bacterium]
MALTGTDVLAALDIDQTSLPLAPRVAGDRMNRAEAVAQIVENYAPGAPEAVRLEAACRLYGWLRDSSPGVERVSNDIGVTGAEGTPGQGQRTEFYLSASPAGLRRSGAKDLLAPWKRRNLGIATG